MLAFISTYLIGALVLEVLRRRMNAPMFIPSGRKHLSWKLNYSFKWWQAEQYLAAMTVGSFCCLVLIAFWILIGSHIDKRWGWLAWSILSVNSLALSIRYFRLVPRFKANAWWLTLFTAFFTIGFGLVASAYADFVIVNETRVDAMQFPVAQKTLGMFLLMFIWVYSATSIIMLAVVFGYMFLTDFGPAGRASVNHLCLNSQSGKRPRPGREEIRQSALRVIVWTSLLFTFSSINGVWGFFFAHAREGTQEMIVFASFHLHPRDCSIPGRPQNARAALINDGRVVIATPIARGYEFETQRCDMQSTQSLKSERARRMKLDDYF